LTHPRWRYPAKKLLDIGRNTKIKTTQTGSASINICKYSFAKKNPTKKLTKDHRKNSVRAQTLRFSMKNALTRDIETPINAFSWLAQNGRFETSSIVLLSVVSGVKYSVRNESSVIAESNNKIQHPTIIGKGRFILGGSLLNTLDANKIFEYYFKITTYFDADFTRYGLQTGHF
jgi:hypothetical protein